MKINNWSARLVAAIAAERGKTKALKRFVASAVVGGSLALAAGPVAAQTNHAIQDPGFDDVNLVESGKPGGTGHWSYVRDLTDYPWVAGPTGGNNNTWLYNTAYSVGFAGVSAPLRADNAAHLADGSLFQIVGDSYVSGRKYTLSAWVRYDSDEFVGDDFGLRLFDGTLGTFDGAEILAAQDYLFGVDIFNDDTWRKMSLSFTAGANANGKPIGMHLGPEAPANRITVDDVTLTSVLAPLPGDFNLDNVVDAADYVVWREVDGSQDGYDEWRENFGSGTGSSAEAGQLLFTGSVPEPATCLLFGGAAAAGALVLRLRPAGLQTVTG